MGASGYTGEEVVRLLSLHPTFAVSALTADSQAGKVSSSINTTPLTPLNLIAQIAPPGGQAGPFVVDVRVLRATLILAQEMLPKSSQLRLDKAGYLH